MLFLVSSRRVPLLLCMFELLSGCVCVLTPPPSPLLVHVGYFTALSRNLALCRHLAASSERLFRYDVLPMILMMCIFSVRHSWQALPPLWYVGAVSTISHLSSGSAPSLCSHMWCESVVAFLCVSWRNENLCELNLFLKFRCYLYKFKARLQLWRL